LDHNKPFGTKNHASNSKLFWNQDKSEYSCPLPQQLLTNFC
jgi:hypothetical protein